MSESDGSRVQCSSADAKRRLPMLQGALLDSHSYQPSLHSSLSFQLTTYSLIGRCCESAPSCTHIPINLRFICHYFSSSLHTHSETAIAGEALSPSQSYWLSLIFISIFQLPTQSLRRHCCRRSFSRSLCLPRRPRLPRSPEFPRRKSRTQAPCRCSTSTRISAISSTTSLF